MAQPFLSIIVDTLLRSCNKRVLLGFERVRLRFERVPCVLVYIRSVFTKSLMR